MKKNKERTHRLFQYHINREGYLVLFSWVSLVTDNLVSDASLGKCIIVTCHDCNIYMYFSNILINGGGGGVASHIPRQIM